MPCDSNHWLTGCTAGELQGTQHPSRWLGSGFGEKGLKIATKSIRELIHGLLMQQPQLHFRDWGGNQAIRPHPEHCTTLGSKICFFFSIPFMILSQWSDAGLHSRTSSLQNSGGEFSFCSGVGEREWIPQGREAEEGGFWGTQLGAMKGISGGWQEPIPGL